jgi:hypothetical protein
VKALAISREFEARYRIVVPPENDPDFGAVTGVPGRLRNGLARKGLPLDIKVDARTAARASTHHAECLPVDARCARDPATKA